MLVSEIWDTAKGSQGYGSCDESRLYEAITEAVSMLSDKGSWDWMIGYMSICAFDGYITLPREVEKIMAANIDGYPSWARDQWYIHHINGTGDFSQMNSYKAFHDEVGTFSTFRCVPEPSLLVGIPELSSDEGKEMLVYGYDWSDKELAHTDPTTGKEVKGIRVPITLADPPSYPDPSVVKKIDRVVKPETDGCVALWSFPQCYDDDTDPTLLAYYYADETAPRYRRYRFPEESCVKIKFRRKNLVFRSQNDFIPFDSRLALMMGLKAVKFYHDANMEKGLVFEGKAIELLRAEQKARKAKNTIGPQIKDFSSYNSERLRGGRRTSTCCAC